jgi:hypothetical protein
MYRQSIKFSLLMMMSFILICASVMPQAVVLAAEAGPIVYEAEALPHNSSNGSGGTLARKTNSEAAASNGVNVEFAFSNTTGQWVELSFNVPEAGIYDVSYRYKQNTPRGIYQASIDGAEAGAPLNHAGPSTYLTEDLGSIHFETAGTHTIRFTIVGKTSTSSGTAIVLDYIQLMKQVNADPSNTGIQKSALSPNVKAVNNIDKTLTVIEGTTIAELLAQIQSNDGTFQSYSAAKNPEDELEEGDQLIVTSEDRTQSAVYIIRVEQRDLSGNTDIRTKPNHPNVMAVNVSARTVQVVNGTTVEQLTSQVESTDGYVQSYTVTTSSNVVKAPAVPLISGDKLSVMAENGIASVAYSITVDLGNSEETSAGILKLTENRMTAGTTRHIQLEYNVTSKVVLTTSAPRHPTYPTWEVVFTLPDEIRATTNDEVSIIGMDKRKLEAGEISDSGKTITLVNLELQPNNGIDVLLYLNAKAVPAVSAQGYEFKATNAILGKKHSVGAQSEIAVLTSVLTVSDLKRVIKVERYTEPDYTQTQLSWITPVNAANVKVEASTDGGATWSDAMFTTEQKTVTWDDVYKIRNINGQLVDRKPASEVVDLDNIVVGLHEIPKYAAGVSVTTATVTNLQQNKNYEFRLQVAGGENEGVSNTAKYFTGHFNILDFGAVSAPNTASAINNTKAIQDAFDTAAATGGGTVYVPPGIYGQGTVYLRSNVYLYLEEGSVLWALRGAIDDRGVRLNQYQDGGHSFHHSAMFYGLRLDNIKIIGTGLISGGTAMITGDPASGSGQSDKQVSITLCTNYEFGGYGAPAGNYALNDKQNKLKVQKVGHFQLLSGGVDYMDIHDVYVVDEDTTKKFDSNNNLIGYVGGTYTNRDIFDLMSDSFVSIVNIYAEFAADDIVKLGSDYALGFKRDTGNYRVDNIEAWTWCNVFQIGSETVGDISNIHVSNIKVHQADKSGFSISINDGTTVNNLLLDGTNTMTGTKSPITMAISNRGRRPGGPEAGLVGGIKNVTLKNITITEARGVKSNETWAPTVSGFYNKDTGKTHYAENIAFDNIHIVTKAANPTRSSEQISLGQKETDPVKDAVTVEMPTNYNTNAGAYNVKELGQRPSYGFYARHVKGLTIKNSTTTFEYDQDDGRYAVVIEDVLGATIDNLAIPKFSAKNDYLIKAIQSSGISFLNSPSLGNMSNVDVADYQEFPSNTPLPSEPAAYLSGASSVQSGGTFELTYGLEHVEDNIYGHDLVVAYDPTKLEFVSAHSMKEGFTIVTQQGTPGQVRWIAAVIGEGNAENVSGDTMLTQWKAKPLTEPADTTITLTRAIVANGDGDEIELDSVSHGIHIAYVDKTALNELISRAEAAYHTAVEGTQPGQYPVGSKAALWSAISKAQETAGNPASTDEQVTLAAEELGAALAAFEASVQVGIPGDVGGDGKVSVGDLAIVANIYGKSSADADWDLYKHADLNHDGKIDIEDLAIIARKILQMD